LSGWRRGRATGMSRCGCVRDNTFQLEYRDGVPSEHYQTRTVSREKAAEAMIGWMKRDPTWKDAFQWTNIGSMFEGDYQGNC
jgi:hypothetical protein